MKTYIVKTSDLKKLIDLDEDMSNEEKLEITVSKISIKTRSSKVTKLLEERIKKTVPGSTFQEAVFESKEVDSKIAEEVRQHFEEKGYVVKIERIGDYIKIKVLWENA